MYKSASHNMMKYYTKNFKTKIKLSSAVVSTLDNSYDITLHRRVENSTILKTNVALLLGVVSVSFDTNNIVYSGTKLSCMSMKKEISEQEMYLELMLMRFIKNARLYNRKNIVVMTDNLMFVDVLSSFDFEIMRKTSTLPCLYNCSLTLPEKQILVGETNEKSYN